MNSKKPSSPPPQEQKISPARPLNISHESPKISETSLPSATSTSSDASTTNKYRGFASWDREKICIAGRKGGIVRRSQLGAIGYSELGRLGGIKSGIKRKQEKMKQKEK